MGEPSHDTPAHLVFSLSPAEALEQMMDRYGTEILKTAYFYLKDRHMAEDLTQETLLRAYRSWRQFRGGSVRTWLLVIAANLCRDRLRSRSFTEQAADPADLDQGATGSLEDEVTRRLEKTTILKHVLALPQPFQEAIYYYYYQELSTQEIAQVTGWAEGTVRSRLHRARALLKEQLIKEGLNR